MTFGECFCLESINVASSLQKGSSSVKLDLGFLWISVGSKFSVTFSQLSMDLDFDWTMNIFRSEV